MEYLDNIELSVELRQVINADLAHHYRVVPKNDSGNILELFVETENATEAISEELELYLGKKIVFCEVPKAVLIKALYEYYRKEEFRKGNNDGPIISADKGFLENLIMEAKAIGSSDIHFEVYEDEARIRFRIDGLLIEKYKIPSDTYLELINKIKIEANLDITEKRLPQDGRINFEDFDIRVSILPTLHGEKTVMRLLGRDTSHLRLEDVGFEEEQYQMYGEAIKQSNGIVLISGPTGSGKTTTLYATLKLLNDNKRNIVTVEDPIEYTLKGINQVQLKEDIGLTFTSALRSFLRQDPDIIMLGEIRDAETAKMAIRASLTGHLVLSTIHTNSAIGTISRLVDMGIPAFYIAETLNASVAQRLLRKLCGSCKEETPFDRQDFPMGYRMPQDLDGYYRPKGCPDCYYTGYKGRIAIYELIPMTHEIVSVIKEHPQNIKDNINYNYQSLADKAFDLLANGTTSIEEIYSLLINA
ncbi:GspE/PulE family protein [Flagellimonas pacifica]|uniref:General secretion pathway protein E/type IV pilus assembly protein PilB n=1 Tax=Flagellimonas pacifica TaxID=1247520 RepID=A0A285MYT4_9FLAO|nr:GspE/PulE family protein [Allomuricauda parva]SNZ01697.1 general secretion pathway protein E/type IV pilus assembly protein PilB [Allomuricauda parva]